MMRQFSSLVLSVLLSIASSTASAGGMPNAVNPVVFVSLAFGGNGSSEPRAGVGLRNDIAEGFSYRSKVDQSRLGESAAPREYLVELKLVPARAEELRVLGVTLFKRSNGVGVADADGSTTAESSSWLTDWKVVAAVAVGAIALAVGGGGGDEEGGSQEQEQERASQSVCAVRGGGTGVPDVCTSTPG